MDMNIDKLISVALPILPIVLLVLMLILIIKAGYIKASPDQAFIISGMRKTPKVLIGRAGLRIPFFEKKDVLSLQLIPIDVKTSQSVPTADYININIDAVVNVQILVDEESIRLASKNFLNKDAKYIATVAREVLEGNMREIVGKMNLEAMVSDRQQFSELVRENAKPDLAAIGLDILNFTVQNFTDGNGVIDNLGVDNVVRIQKSAAISRANSERDIAIAQSQAASEADEARVKADTEIAERANALAIKQAELKAQEDEKKAIADAAYRIMEEKQRLSIDVASAEANIAAQEKERELQEKKAAVAEQELNATVRKQADADKYRREREAEAELVEREKEAEASLVLADKAAQAEMRRAEAAKYVKEMEAAGIAAVGKAEAEAIQAKGEAEAAAMEKRAQAYEKYGKAAITEMIVKVLPDMAREISQSVTTIDKVSIIDSGNGVAGVETVGGWTPGLLKKTIEAVKDTTGFDVTEVMRAGTYDAKVNRNLNVEGHGGCSHKCSGNCGHVDGPRFDGDHDHVCD